MLLRKIFDFDLRIDGDYSEKFTCWPPYQSEKLSRKVFEETTEEEIDHIRRQYAGNISMIDNHLGKVFDTLDRLELWDDTILILTTDHGHEIAERGRFGKSYPHWNTNANIPLIIWDPRYPGNGRRARTFSCTVDFYPTILDGLGVKEYDSPDGRTLLPAVKDPSWMVRDSVLYGTFNQGACVATEDYTYFSGYDNLNNPVYWYSTQMPFLFLGSSLKESVSGFFIPGVDMPVWRTPVNWYLLDSPKQKEAMLFRMDIDRDQKNNIISSDLKGRDYCRDLMIRLMQETSAPEEQFIRLGLKEK